MPRRKSAISAAVEEESQVDLTPMLDVVFIMLIFFIVTANFIRDPGIEVSRPEANTATTQTTSILVAIGKNGDIWMDGRRIDVRQVKANIVRLRADNPKGGIVIRADIDATAERIVAVADAAREAGVYDISIGTEQ
ncbi:MAG: biopolymer transporter ExbD [Gammaproteobacteria bacterium AqS3]|nr:biopolymer transporter ExbD [Gammaproteobacteria bacterium AqS3]